ncbi:MAG: hypothetical protein V4597_11770 [Pseudomonadota bacterium]
MSKPKRPVYIPQEANEPAFPSSDDFQGMTMREWYAGQALSALAGRFPPAEERTAEERTAEACFRYADAMLTAAKK